MIPYASRTGTRLTLASLRTRGWRLMVSAKGPHRTEGFPYALDNGAWWAFANAKPFDAAAFMRAYEKLASGADFVVLPDIVGGGVPSLEFSLDWLERLRPAPCPLLMAVQDGMVPSQVAPLIGPKLGLFVGGTTEWKLANLAMWARTARMTNSYFHVGRVNTVKRIALCASVGANSFDGSSVSRFPISLSLLDSARKQPDMFPQEDHLT